jgi:hypothetical protein
MAKKRHENIPDFFLNPTDEKSKRELRKKMILSRQLNEEMRMDEDEESRDLIDSIVKHNRYE